MYESYSKVIENLQKHASKYQKTQKNSQNLAILTVLLEAPPGIGPGMKVLQTSALPLGYGAVQLGTGTFPHSVFYSKAAPYVTAFEKKRARCFVPVIGADYGARTRHLHLGKVALYQMS